MHHVMQDVRTALRGLRRTPAFTATAVVILGLGIGMSVAIFTVFDALLLRPLPVHDQERVVVLWTHRGDPTAEVSGSFKQLSEQLRPESRTMRDVAAVAHWGAVPTPFLDGDGSITLNRSLVSGNYFDVLGARAELGRLLRPDDEVSGSAHSMVISHAAWQRSFGGDPAIVGRRVRDAWGPASYTIVGVAPPGLDYPVGVEAWTPPWSPMLSAYAVARLAPGATATAARDEFLRIEQRILPDWRLVGATVTPLHDAILGNVRPMVRVLLAAVGLLLLIACVNVGNLLLVRATSRGRELAVRRALGASYGDVVRQLLVESSVLGVAGGAVGLLCSQALLRLLVILAPAHLPRIDDLRVEGVPLAVTAVVTIVATLLFGVVPAVSGAGASLSSSLRLDTRSGTESRLRRRVRQSLVASQVALALVLLAGAGLLVRSLERLTQVDLGYAAEHLSIIQLSWTSAATGKLVPLGETLLDRFRAVPGVTAVSPILIPPFLGANVFHGQVELPDQSLLERERSPSVPLELGDVDYFRTFDIPIVRGRGFQESDREDAPGVAVVSEAVARRLWPDAEPIGQRIRYWQEDTTSWRTVVGVAGDIRFRDLRQATPTIYLPWRQTTAWQLAFAMRTSGALSSVLGAVRHEARVVDPGLTVWDATPIDDFLAGPLAQPRLGTFLLSAFGLVALLLAAIGLYGVMSASVHDQTREFGVRMALGATPGRVRREVLRRAIGVTVGGAVVGLAGALVATRLLSALLFEVSPTDPLALTGACLVLVMVALAAAYLPARRATRIDPAQALRAE